MKIKSLIGLLFLILSFGVTSCSSWEDDTPDGFHGPKVAQWIQDNVLTSPTSIEVFAGDAANGCTLYGAVPDEATARWFCSEMIGSSWNGEPTVYDVPDSYGTIHLSSSDEEGVFCTAVVNVRSIEPFTLHLATKEYCSSDNLRHP